MANDGKGNQGALGYEHTLMYGRYREDLGEWARTEALRIKAIEKLRKKEEKLIQRELKTYRSEWQRKCIGYLSSIWRHTFARLGEDWVFLSLLGIISSLLSFTMDFAIALCQKARIWLYRDLTQQLIVQYLAWLAFPLTLILFGSGFVHIVAPQAIGSGIPEMKTILRGVVLKEYLTFRTLVSKMVGLTCALGSGMPLGKENESRTSEMLAAACAVGVACSFAAPIGGVLFSIEVTSVFFAVRNYWRGFFAAACGAMVWRLLGVWFKDEETITALFKTNFRVDFPFDPQELVAFAMIGVFCGFAGALFVWFQQKIVEFNRKQKKMNVFLQKNRFLYPAIITTLIATVTFPPGLGQFMASEIAVLIANAIAQSLQPSIYDCIIKIKKLPYLPPILSTSSEAHNIYVEDFMVRNMVYVWQGATYRDLKLILKVSKRIRTLPLVESPDTMMLLGSINRIELAQLVHKQLGRERRLQEVARHQSMDDILHKSPREQRRMSRFEVVPVTGSGRPSPRGSPPPTPSISPKIPKKSILKHSPMQSPYSTITSQDSKLRQAFEAIFRKALTLQDVNPSDKSDTSAPNTPTTPKRVQLPKERVIDMSPEEQLAWEEEQMNSQVDFSDCHIDPAPFQLVEHTSLVKVHSLFSMLGLNHAYVTAIGKLVGIVALKEVRQAIENVHVIGTRSNSTGGNDPAAPGGRSASEPPSETHSESEDASEPGRMSFRSNKINGSRSSPV